MKRFANWLKFSTLVVVLTVAAAPAMALNIDVVWMRHEPGDNQVDQYGHNGGPGVPETNAEEDGRGIGGGILGMASLANGGYVYGRASVQTDWFVHDGAMNETADAENQAGLTGSTFLDVVGLSNGNFAWGRKNGSNLADVFVHSSSTAAEIGRKENTRGLNAPYNGMAPVANGNFVWGRTADNELQWFIHDGKLPNVPEIATNEGGGRGPGPLNALGVAGLANGNFVYARSDGDIEFFINSGTTALELANNNFNGRPLGDGFLGLIGLANGNFAYARASGGTWDLGLHDGTTAAELDFDADVAGLGTFLGMVPLVDGSFVMARENNAGQMDLFQYSGTDLSLIGTNLDGRGIGAGGSLFDGIVGLVPEPSACTLCGFGIALLASVRRRQKRC